MKIASSSNNRPLWTVSLPPEISAMVDEGVGLIRKSKKCSGLEARSEITNACIRSYLDSLAGRSEAPKGELPEEITVRVPISPAKPFLYRAFEDERHTGLILDAAGQVHLSTFDDGGKLAETAVPISMENELQRIARRLSQARPEI